MKTATDGTRERVAELTREAEQLLTDHPDGLVGDDAVRFEELERQIERQKKLVEIRTAAQNPANIERGADERQPSPVAADPWETPIEAHTRDGVTRSQALTAVERWNADDGIKEAATATLERLDLEDADPVSEFVIRTSHPLYVSAYAKYARNPEGYGAELTPEERQVWTSVSGYTRSALGLSGAVLPSPLDPAIVLTNAGTLDPMRQVARVDTTTSNTKRYITSAGVTASFDAELTEVSDDTPTLTEVEITCRKAQAFVQASIEAWLDQPGFFAVEVAKMFGDAKARLEGDAFIRGVAGSNQPIGLETALAGGSSEINAAGEAIVAADVFGLIEDLPARWQGNAKWMAELSTLNAIEQMETTNGAKMFDQIGAGSLLRRQVIENSNVDPYSSVDAGATANNYVLLVGDFNQYVILDRVGMLIEFIRPGHIVNTANNRPDGRVGAYAFWRVGADSLVDGAFRLLDVQTSA